MEDKEQLKNRFKELAARYERTGIAQFTKFLNMEEQSVLLGLKLGCALEGGYEQAERRIAVFGEAESLPIACVRVFPAAKRFSDELTHRDFLGSVMALGINREVLGDIITVDNEAYLICLDSIADYITENLTKVRHTTVCCEHSAVPDAIKDGGEERSLVVPSERLDAVIAAVWKLSREDAKTLVEKGLVYINSKQTVKAGATVPENAAVSVRGKGRFCFLGLERETKKGKLRVRVRVN